MATGYDSFQAGTASAPTSLVEMTISCRNLMDTDIFSKSDPMCVVYMQDGVNEQWYEVGRTETIMNSLNPDFVKKIVLNYHFEEHQKMKFLVYDIDSASRDLRDHDFLGSMECSLAEIITGGCLQRKLDGQNIYKGSIIAVVAEEISNCKDEVNLHFMGEKLDKKDFFGKSDPFLVISRVNENGSYTIVHKTEYIACNLNPQWRPFSITSITLCNGDELRDLKFECYDWNSSGNHEIIGEFHTNLRTLMEGRGEKNKYLLINEKKKAKKKSYQNSGIVTLISSSMNKIYSFLDYIKGGTQLNCTIAIDFTASNGNPTTPGTLHYMDHHQPNQYLRALQAVGEIIVDYDSDKLFPVLGFGARLPPHGQVSHEFFVNGHDTNPFCEGIPGIIDAYQTCLRRIQLYGPTNFSPIINHVARFARECQDGSQYFILLILTDGVITDMIQTKEAIVKASPLPLSIIIVGVGNAEFDAMEELDGDDVRISWNGKYASRDIVQFVPFRNFIHTNKPSDIIRSKIRLAKEVLAEVPTQIVSFMKSKGIKPAPPCSHDMPLPTDYTHR